MDGMTEVVIRDHDQVTIEADGQIFVASIGDVRSMASGKTLKLLKDAFRNNPEDANAFAKVEFDINTGLFKIV